MNELIVIGRGHLNVFRKTREAHQYNDTFDIQ